MTENQNNPKMLMKLAVFIFYSGAVFADLSIVNVTMEEKEVFLGSNTNLVCVLYRNGTFKGNFRWYLNGSDFEIKTSHDEGVALVMPISMGKKVIYEIQVTEAGSYTCSVTESVHQFNRTARVVDFQGITKFQLVNLGDDETTLTCPDGPPGTSAFIKVNNEEGPVDGRVKITADSILLKDPKLSDADKDYMCEYVFTDDIAADGGREHILQNRIVSAKLPVIFYEPIRDTISTDKVNYTLKIQPLGRDIWVQICWTNNGSFEASCDNTTVMLDTSVLHVNFTIYKGVKLLLTEPFKDSRQQEPEKKEESDSPFGIIVGVIMGILVVAGILVFLIIIRRQRKLCFKKAAVSKEDQARMKPLVPKDENGTQDAVEMKEMVL